MSFYTPGLKPHVVDAVHDSTNFRTEFRLKPNTVYLTNFRIANLGAKLVNADIYNPLAGAAALIKSIHIYDGNQLLDQLLEFPLWAGFTSYNQSNKANVDMRRALLADSTGFVYEGLDLPNVAGDAVVNNALIRPRHDSPKATNDADSSKSWLSLKSLLPFLDASLYCPTTVFQNLRVVIQYNTNPAQLGVRSTGAVVATDVTSFEPILLVDEVVNPDRQHQIAKSYKGVRYNAIEHDRVPISAIDVDAGSAPTTKTVGGFNNKHVTRFLLVNSLLTASDTDATLGLGSAAMFKQGVQIRMNGRNIFPASGITKPNQRLSLLTDVWGTCNSFNGTNQVQLSTGDGTIDRTIVQNVAVTRTFVGNLDYCAFSAMAGEPIQELQIDYTRFSESGAAAAQHGAMNLNIFGEVMKQIVVSPGNGYSINYV
jgi:hypothetical protein